MVPEITLSQSSHFQDAWVALGLLAPGRRPEGGDVWIMLSSDFASDRTSFKPDLYYD